MSGLESWGTSFILWLQSFGGPGVDLVFKLITLLGDEKFYLLLLPLVYWCIDKRLGIRLAVLVMASNTVNLGCKFAFGLPRPPVPPVRPIAVEEGFGFPSGHTQAVTVAFGWLARHSRRWGAYVGAGALVFLVGLSRLYLGVHFPHDVVGGLVIGLFVLFVFEAVQPPLERRWLSAALGLRATLALGVPFLVLAVWPQEDVAGTLGALAGFAVGGLIEAEAVRLAPAGSPLQRALRFLVGLVGMGLLYFGLSAVLPAGIWWRFGRYALVALFASAAAPWLFVRLQLAQAEGKPTVREGL